MRPVICHCYRLVQHILRRRCRRCLDCRCIAHGYCDICHNAILFAFNIGCACLFCCENITGNRANAAIRHAVICACGCPVGEPILIVCVHGNRCRFACLVQLDACICGAESCHLAAHHILLICHQIVVGCNDSKCAACLGCEAVAVPCPFHADSIQCHLLCRNLNAVVMLIQTIHRKGNRLACQCSCHRGLHPNFLHCTLFCRLENADCVDYPTFRAFGNLVYHVHRGILCCFHRHGRGAAAV